MNGTQRELLKMIYGIEWILNLVVIIGHYCTAGLNQVTFEPNP